MTGKNFKLTFLLSICIASFCCIAPSLLGQNDGTATANKDDKNMREKAYFVFFENIEEIFNYSGRGIYLPYKDFLKLWHAADQNNPTKNPEDDTPEVVVIQNALYKGQIEGKLARFEVEYSIESLKKGWASIPFDLRGVALESYELSDPKALLASEGSWYKLHLPDAGKYSLKINFSIRVSENPGKKLIAFNIPRTASSRFELAIPEEELRVQVSPMKAASQNISKDGQTHIMAFLGNSSEISVEWMPPAGRSVSGGALLLARQSMNYYLGERMLRGTTDIEYEVLRGEVSQLKINMPTNTRLLAVKGENLREWDTQDGVLNIKLHTPISQRYRLHLKFERILEETPKSLSIPFPKTQGVLRETGWVAFQHDSSLSVRTSNLDGLSQLDPDEIPQHLRGNARISFRYLAHPLVLALEVEKIEPIVHNNSVSLLQLGKEEDHFFGWIDYNIQKAGLFRLSFEVAGDWEVDSVGKNSQVEEFKVRKENGNTRINLSLQNKAIGALRLPFRLVRNGSAKNGKISLHALRVIGSTQDRGLLGLSAPRALEIITSERKNLVDADANELLRTGLVSQVGKDAALPRCFRYRKLAASATIELKEKQTEVEALSQHLVEVADGEIRQTHWLDYNVKFAPVDRLRFSAPSALDQSLKIEAKNKTQVQKISSADGRTLWEVLLQPPVLGSITFTVTHTHDLQSLESGKSYGQGIALIHAAEVRSEEGFIAVRKDGSLEIEPEVSNMEAMDGTELPSKLRRGQIYSAFRYFGKDPLIKLNLTRYDYEALALAYVAAVHMQAVLSIEQQLKVQMRIIMQNSELQYLELNKAENTRILSCHVNGQLRTPKRKAESDTILIPIPKSQGARGSFPVVIEYEQSLSPDSLASFGSINLQSLEIAGELPVNKLELDLYLPPEYAFLSFSGNLHKRGENESLLWPRFHQIFQETSQSQYYDFSREDRQQAEVVLGMPVNDFQQLRFESLAPIGKLNMKYANWNLFWFLDFLLLVAGAMISFFALRKIKASSLSVFLCLVFMAWIPLSFSRGPSKMLWASLLFGVLGYGAIFLLAKIPGALAERKKKRLVFAPDPFIEEAEAKTDATAEAKNADGADNDSQEADEEADNDKS